MNKKIYFSCDGFAEVNENEWVSTFPTPHLNSLNPARNYSTYPLNVLLNYSHTSVFIFSFTYTLSTHVWYNQGFPLHIYSAHQIYDLWISGPLTWHNTYKSIFSYAGCTFTLSFHTYKPLTSTHACCIRKKSKFYFLKPNVKKEEILTRVQPLRDPCPNFAVAIYHA